MLIVSLTTWYKRVLNLPTVLDSILSNTMLPDRIMVNLSEEDFPDRILPESVTQFITGYHNLIKLNWEKENMKTYKKIFPVFREYPNAWVICADDDIIYPEDFVESFLICHALHPNAPISGNNYYHDGIKYQCGAASMVCAKHFEGWEQYYTPEFVEKCPANDIFCTQLALRNGYQYIELGRSFDDPQYRFQDNDAYSTSDGSKQRKSLDFLEKEFGYTVKKWFRKEERPLCFFGVMNVPRGLRLMREMLEWLQPRYNVITVVHDGTKFEYPPLKLMQNIVINSDYHGPVMYIHTKGAWFVRRTSECVRNVWKHEFTKRKDEYLKAVATDEPVIAAPYSGIVRGPKPGFEEGQYPMEIPWFNGYIANDAAVRKMNIFLSGNRFVYEGHIYQGIHVEGMREKDIDTSIQESRDRMYTDVLKF